MLFGIFPFLDPQDALQCKNNRTITHIINVEYAFPEDIPVSEDVKDLIRSIFVTDPARRFTVDAVMQHSR